MSSNPNNAVGTNAAYGGRTSVKAFNDNIGAYSRGIISGWACSPSSGMTVALGGNGTTRDIAIAEDVSGNKITVNNISESPISVTMSAAPSSNSRIDLIVAYVDNPPQGSATALDNPAACGLITVKGTAAANPVAPNESAIRTAITADGASGSTAYYVILAQITIAAGTTDIVARNISAGSAAGIGAKNIDFATMSAYAKSNSEPNIVYTSNLRNGTTICRVNLSAFSNGDTVALIGYYKENGDGESVTMVWGMFDDTNNAIIANGYEAGNTWGGSRSVNTVITKTNQTTVSLRAYKQENRGSRSAQSGATIIAIKIG